MKSFRDYIDLFIKDKTDDNGMPLKVVYEKVNDRWEVGLTLSEKGFQQASFVNSIATTKVSFSGHQRQISPFISLRGKTNHQIFRPSLGGKQLIFEVCGHAPRNLMLCKAI